jgi:HAD superfamily hydrolase (TIGR01509 family)
VTIRAVVFDFDGVIANSEPLHFQGFRDVLAESGRELSKADYYGRYLGFDDTGAFAAMASDYGLRRSDADIAEMVRRKAVRVEVLEREASILFPGARDAVGRLAAVCPLAIASGALRAEIVRILEREDLARHFVTIVAAEDTAASKPAPDPYLRAVDQLSQAIHEPLVPSQCAAIEDSRWGLDSARAAGLRTIGITHTYPAALLGDADLVIDHLDALTWDMLSARLS